jgi:uncharacterized protein
MRAFFILGAILLALYLAVCALLYFKQNALLFFPTHFAQDTDLSPWIIGGNVIGYCREANNPEAVWLCTHGNGGQADQRSYLLRRMSDRDSLYVLEYPGYGLRNGRPSKSSIDAAAKEAYHVLRSRFHSVPVCVVGESMGSGPACYLATDSTPPDKVVLIVPSTFCRVLRQKSFLCFRFVC